MLQHRQALLHRRSSQTLPACPTRVHACRLRNVVSCAADNKVIYQGVYGPWSIEEDDEREVFLYRLGINMAAAAAVSSAVMASLPEGSGVREALLPALNPICLVGAAGLGLSLTQIHIYMDFIKRTLQALWLLGLTGGIFLMITQDTPVAVYAAQHREAVWVVGPMFAALTGVAFKEGLCYGKAEAAGLFGAVPLMMLGHLSGLLPAAGEQGLLASFCILLSIFAGRKWTQAVKDDIGDKSVFMFLKLPFEEQEQRQEAMIRTRQQAGRTTEAPDDNDDDM